MKQRYRTIPLIVAFSFLILYLAACGGPKEETDMAFNAEIMGETLDGLYNGMATKKIPDGEGTFSYSDEDIDIQYSGTWEEGVETGISQLQYNGMKLVYGEKTYIGDYSGEAVDGQPEGNGLFIAEMDDGFFEYDGQWKNGEISEKGFLKNSSYIVNYLDGTVKVGEYEGETLDGLASGSGIYKAENNKGIAYTYTGEWKNGLCNGHGRMEFESGDPLILEGSFTDGLFDPTPIEYFKTYGTIREKSYDIPDSIQSFIIDNPSIFLENSLDSYDGDVETSFKFKTFSKNPVQYGPTVVSISGLNVVQIQEENYWGADHTFCILDNRNDEVYYVCLYGFFDNIYEGSKVTLTAVPLDYFTYPSVGGSKIWSIACAGISLS